MSTVFLNGAFVEVGGARVSAFDAGFQHGVGLFETMTAVVGGSGDRPRVLMLWEHLERLKTSALELGLVSTLHSAALAEAVERAVAKEAESARDTERFRVRLTVSGGDLNMLARKMSADGAGGGSGGAGGGGGGESRNAHEPTLLIHVQPATMYPEEMFERGVRAVVGGLRVNPLDPTQGHKTLNYWARLRELQAAAGSGAGEALIFQVTNFLSGGCVSNAFVVKGGELWTPIARGEEADVAEGKSARHADEDLSKPPAEPGTRSGFVPSPVLPGITRQWVMDWATGAGIPVRRRMIGITDVLEADEVFLTNSSWGVLPVVGVEQSRIGAGEPGPITNRALSAYHEFAGANDNL